MESVATVAKRIGVFGGAFDPPHKAHFVLAQVAVAELQLDELRIIPTGQAWHKVRTLTPARHRLAMARLAFSDLPQAVIDPRETERTGPSYTVDTLREFKGNWPNAKLFLIIGDDQAKALPTWHNFQEILQLATICVAARGSLVEIAPKFVTFQAQESRLIRLTMSPMAVSATDIRATVAAHQSVLPLVFEPVARYIDQHHLYQTV